MTDDIKTETDPDRPLDACERWMAEEYAAPLAQAKSRRRSWP